jgi:hypothetical protein
VIKNYRQQTCLNRHHNRLMLKIIPLFLLAIILITSGCRPKVSPIPILLSVEDASKEKLLGEVNRFAKVGSMSAKMYLKFEDTSFAKKGSKTSYITVDGSVVVQRPANIFLKVEFFSADIAEMTSNGEKFRVAVLKDNSGGKYVKFITGTNKADYSKLQSGIKEDSSADAKSVSSFSNLRPQHFTDAILIRPTDPENVYLQSTIYQQEVDEGLKKSVMRGYYLLDEFVKDANGELKITRRFWFDRVVSIRLARQQLFDTKGEIESDIIYGQEGNLTKTGEYNNLPLRITVTRPKDKYTMSLTYKSPESVVIGKTYPATAFDLQNTRGLEEVDLDKNLKEATGQRSAINNQ